MRNQAGLSRQAEQLIANYHRYLTQRNDINPSTIHHYVGDITAFAEWYEVVSAPQETFNLGHIDTNTLMQYRNHLQESTRLKASSVNRHFASLRSLFEWAVEEHLLPDNPTKAIQRAAERQVTRVLSETEVAALMQVLEQANLPSERWDRIRDRAVIYLMLHAGLRIEEVQLLRRDQVDMNEQRGSLRQVGKPGQQRNVPLNSIAHIALKEHLDQLRTPSEYVFPSDRSRDNAEEPITGRTIHNLISRYTQLAGIGDLKPHDLRHTFCYRLAKAGMPAERIAQITGSAIGRAKRYQTLEASK